MIIKPDTPPQEIADAFYGDWVMGGKFPGDELGDSHPDTYTDTWMQGVLYAWMEPQTQGFTNGIDAYELSRVAFVKFKEML